MLCISVRNEGHKECPQWLSIIRNYVYFTAHTCFLHPYVSLITMIFIKQVSLKKILNYCSVLLCLFIFSFSCFLIKMQYFTICKLYLHLSPSSPCLTSLPGICLLSRPLSCPPLTPPSWHYSVVGRLIEEVCRFVRQSNQSASHKTTG